MKIKKSVTWNNGKGHIDVNIGNGVFWGVILLLTATILILDALDILPTVFSLSVWQTIVAVGSIGWIISGIVKRDFSTTPLSLGFLFMVTKGIIADLTGIQSISEISNWIVLLYCLVLCGFATDNFISFLFVTFTFVVIVLKDWFAILLGLPQLADVSEWMILLCAALIVGGLALIFPSFFRKRGMHASSFGSHERYIDCASFKKAYSKNRFGEYNIYFQNVDQFESGAILTLSNKFGEMTVHIPDDWCIDAKISNTFGEVNLPNVIESDKRIILEGSNKFGEINIVRHHYEGSHSGSFVFDSESEHNSMERYISCTEFENETITCEKSVCDVYFTNINDYKGDATLQINNTKGNVKIHVPNGWKVVSSVLNDKGVDICKCTGGNGPTLNVTGTVHKGVLIIEYYDYEDEAY
ncbi:MAG: hypothetical protein E7312_02050 [Clostridiales bacterium]|nr:hypothetical protein [Clostridiales bacterium]